MARERESERERETAEAQSSLRTEPTAEIIARDRTAAATPSDQESARTGIRSRRRIECPMRHVWSGSVRIALRYVDDRDRRRRRRRGLRSSANAIKDLLVFAERERGRGGAMRRKPKVAKAGEKPQLVKRAPF